MLDLFSEIKSTVLKRRSIQIDTAVFRLNWLVTSALLVAFSLLLTARQYVGQPIDCLIETNIVPRSMINTYCWISQTFIIPSAFNHEIGSEIPHPGIANSRTYPSRGGSLLSRSYDQRATNNDFASNRKYYPYYQWICFVLFIQSIFFYLPHYMWKLFEGGLMSCLSMDLQIALVSEETRLQRKKILAEYLYKHYRMHTSYAYKYFFCELLSFFNIVIQMLMTNYFLDGQFFSFGIDVLNQTQIFKSIFTDSLLSVNGSLAETPNEVKVNPFTYIFPRMTKCTFHFYGSSGDVQSKDAMCLLPLNVFHEKIYLFIWFWFSIMFCLSFLIFFARVFMFVGIRFRARILKTRCKFCSMKHLKIICKKGNIGDFFLFYMLSQNIDPVVLQEVVYDIGKRLARQDEFYSHSQSPRRHNTASKFFNQNLSNSFQRTSSLDQIRPSSKKYNPI